MEKGSGLNPATRVRKRAMDLLARREHTHSELLQKLLSRLPDTEPELIKQALDRLQDEGLLSNERFIESYTHSRQRAGMGPIRIALELQSKGVSESEARTALAQIPAEEWEERVRELVVRRYGESDLAPAVRQKAWRFLLQRGFDSDVIRKVVH